LIQDTRSIGHRKPHPERPYPELDSATYSVSHPSVNAGEVGGKWMLILNRCLLIYDVDSKEERRRLGLLKIFEDMLQALKDEPCAI
jgi:hypothetical protein